MNSKMIFQKIRKIDLIKFFKYNFLMPQVKRTKGAYIIPFKGAIKLLKLYLMEQFTLESII